jgi:hypothetical protein
MNKKILCNLVIGITLITLMLSSVQGTVIRDGNIVLLRSQFMTETVSLDGRLIDDDWQFAGSILLQYGTGENRTDLDMFIMNNENELYIGFRVTEEVVSKNSSATVFFDVDGDGNLTTPEDAKQIYYDTGFTTRDFYYDGSLWAQDRSEGADVSGSARNADGITSYEFRIELLADDLQYDGLRIPNPTNTFIGLNFLVSVNDNGTKTSFSYPSSALNASGYMDTKLAGPEDQDLPEYIPPVVETQTDTQTNANDEYTTEFAQLDAAAGMEFYIAGFGLVSIIVIRSRRR